MGWGSGVDVFDAIASAIIDKDVTDKKALLKAVIVALEDHDWDTQSDSRYWNHPLVREIFKEMNPSWFKSE
jgi:hypothetical protein